jgi:tRNA dimethylallyltransferase
LTARDEPLRVVAGPTAAGKSALALDLAERFGGTIVSADSRQIYRGFDVGTAKPTAAELARAPHRGVDVADPRERWSAARWAADAAGWIAEAEAAGRTPVVVGGTGLYVRALVAPLFDAPPLDEERRARLAAALDPMSTEELRRWVRALDPARAHLGRTQLLRAAETALLAGVRISDLHVSRARRGGVRARYLVVDPGREVLRERIARRVDAMLAGGWADEVRRLLATVPPDAPAWNASGYGAVREWVEGRCTAAAARERVIVETRRYAKRQRTWLRHQLAADDVTVVDPTAPDARERAARWWAGGDAGA